MVMTFPLTVWFGAKQANPNLQIQINSEASLTLLVAGSSQEVTMRACCAELMVLWCGLKDLHIIFVGPDVSPLMHERHEIHTSFPDAASRYAVTSCEAVPFCLNSEHATRTLPNGRILLVMVKMHAQYLGDVCSMLFILLSYAECLHSPTPAVY